MLTLTLMFTVTLCALAFGLLSLAIARQPRGVAPFHRAAWLLTGIASLAHALNKGAHNVFSLLAYRGGPKSDVYAEFIQWSPVFNHSRTFVLVGFFLSLTVLALRKGLPDRRFWLGAGAAMTAGFLFGAWLGLMEGKLVAAIHFSNIASLNGVELILVMAALLALLHSNRADRHLWGALAVYGVGLALAVAWMAGLSYFLMPSTWSPEPWTLQIPRLVYRGIMVGFAVQRLLLARRGINVPGLTERYTTRPSMVGLR